MHRARKTALSIVFLWTTLSVTLLGAASATAAEVPTYDFDAGLACAFPLRVEIRGGTQVSREFTDKDLKVHTSDGQVIGYNTGVKVSGKVYYPLVGQDFKCALENPLIESAR